VKGRLFSHRGTLVGNLSVVFVAIHTHKLITRKVSKEEVDEYEDQLLAAAGLPPLPRDPRDPNKRSSRLSDSESFYKVQSAHLVNLQS
jgi:hypothetical protein